MHSLAQALSEACFPDFAFWSQISEKRRWSFFSLERRQRRLGLPPAVPSEPAGSASCSRRWSLPEATLTRWCEQGSITPAQRRCESVPHGAGVPRVFSGGGDFPSPCSTRRVVHRPGLRGPAGIAPDRRRERPPRKMPHAASGGPLSPPVGCPAPELCVREGCGEAIDATVRALHVVILALEAASGVL